MSLNIGKKLKLKCFFKALDYQDTDAREKNNDFAVEYSSTSAVFLTEYLLEEMKLLEAQN